MPIVQQVADPYCRYGQLERQQERHERQDRIEEIDVERLLDRMVS
jgi:hypothetical protein